MALTAGDVFTTPARRVSSREAASLIGIGGYTHPLFTDPVYAATSRFGRTPLPGQAVLLVMGGLVEQSGRFDDAVALLGFDSIRFVAPAFPDDEVRVEVTVRERDGRVLVMDWRCLNQDGDAVVEAVARMLFSTAR